MFELSTARLLTSFLLIAPGLCTTAACEQKIPLELRVVLPEDHADLDRADNATVVLDPGGLWQNFSIDGVDFALELELEPDDQNHTLTLYLANGADLLAWGRSAPFVFAQSDVVPAIFIGRPGALSTYPGSIDVPDPEVLAAPARGRGMLLLGRDGGTYLFNQASLSMDAGSDFKPTEGIPDPSNGALLADPVGGVLRIVWEQNLQGWRFDPSNDSWTEMQFHGADSLGPRPQAAYLSTPDQTRLFIFGGGTSTEIAQIDLLQNDEGKYQVLMLPEVQLDGPRQGATATWFTPTDRHESEGVFIVGGNDPQLPAVWFAPRAEHTFASSLTFGVSETSDWQHGRCLFVHPSSSGHTIVCAGGIRQGSPEKNALVVRLSEDLKTMSEEWLGDFLPIEMPDPRWLEDDSALYAQSANHWLRIDRAKMTIEDLPSSSTRVEGGHSVQLDTGAIFLVGGITADKQGVERWQVFTPAIVSP